MFVTENKSIVKERKLSEFQKRYQELDRYFSEKELGSIVKDNNTIFRLFAPSAIQVRLCVFDKLESSICSEYFMERDDDGVWEILIDEDLTGKFYGHKVYHTGEDISNPNKPICVDPYSKAVATFTTYQNPRRSIVIKRKEFDWEGTEYVRHDWRDLIIYECHVRDMTIDKSSGAKSAGTYKGLIESDIKGGLNYIKSLGVNAVELLPVHEYGYCELPYGALKNNSINNINPYERNYWGYMTAAYFAPAAYYSEKMPTFRWNRWIGKDGKQIEDFKEMVKAFHKENIAVILDVVYNHFSEYELGNLKQIDKEYYFRLDENGNFESKSWCGNDLKTERPMVRRLIIESLIYWMKEYHIDGFRFDIATLIDWETIEKFTAEAKKINPNVILIAEPWGGGGYNPGGFSDRDWAAWNDQIRNGIKGENPFNGKGWIFGKWFGNNSPRRIKSYVNGTLRRDEYGIYLKKEHSVNYLESHDNYTLGDFIRIASGEIDAHKIIRNVDEFVKLSPRQLKLNKLAALFLFTSQGMVMIHEGQEFARSKVIPYNIKTPDPRKGTMDTDSYNKDNKTNYINYAHAEINKELFDYYKGLIALRNKYEAFRRANYNDIAFFDHVKSEFGLAYLLKYQGEHFTVLFNAEQENDLEFPLPPGNWEILVNDKQAGIEKLGEVSGNIVIPAISGSVLKMIKDRN
ncbi:alpha-amylase family glycosyl hydrolase [Melioribacter sp. OK-6-Me]|uniref:alpha-amylase family glycosyl hydrolase n=1 Tax=unclassified Melioribacter TaxID=2627329 RepID=UPI003ED92C18